VESNRIYQSIKEKIIWLEYEPERVLNLSELAEHCGTSRTPIKEVLIFLQAEGWVLRTGSHFMVTPLSLNRIREITEIRASLETQAYLWAMQRISVEELIALTHLENEIAGIECAISNKRLIALDSRLHAMLYRASRNAQTARLLENLLAQYLRFWLSIPREIDIPSFFEETKRIIRAVKGKDEKGLRAASEEHIRKSFEEIMGTF